MDHQRGLRHVSEQHVTAIGLQPGILVRKNKNNNHGYAEVLAFKKEVLEWFMKDKMHEFGWNSDIKETIRSKLKDHATYRSEVCPLSSSQKVDTQWMKGWPRSACLMLEFLEGLVFARLFDSALKNAVLKRKAPNEVMDYKTIKERVADISEVAEAADVAAVLVSLEAAGADDAHVLVQVAVAALVAPRAEAAALAEVAAAPEDADGFAVDGALPSEAGHGSVSAVAPLLHSVRVLSSVAPHATVAASQ